MTAQNSNFANAYEGTLTAEMGSSDLTAVVDSTTGAPSSPCYLCIEPTVGARREYVFFDGTFTGTTFVASALGKRYLDGSAAGSGLTHPIGSKVRSVPAAQMFEDLHDRIDTKLTTADHDTRDHSAAVGTAVLADLSDVAATAPSDGQVLTFDTTNGWQPETPGGGPVLSGAQVKRTASQSVATATATPVQFNGEDFDTDDFHDNATDNTRVTVPTTGKYRISGQVRFQPSSTGYRAVLLRKNGTTDLLSVEVDNAGATASTHVPIPTRIFDLTAGDYVEALGTQTSGGDLNVEANNTYLLVELAGS